MPMGGYTTKIVSTGTCTGEDFARVLEFRIMSWCSRYDFIAVLDWDDLIIPVLHNTWEEMIQNISQYSGKVTSFNFKNYYYLDEVMDPGKYEPDIPKYLHMMQHVFRSVYIHFATNSDKIIFYNLLPGVQCLQIRLRVSQAQTI